MKDVIKFYRAKEKYGCFSNFSKHAVEIYGETWKTSEHAFQAQKFAGKPEHYGAVYAAKTPGDAAFIGRDKDRPLRADWEKVKDEIMYTIVFNKFCQHHRIQEVLTGTGDAHIIENSPYDSYWGCGADGKGKNKLGKILMEVRELLRWDV